MPRASFLFDALSSRHARGASPARVWDHRVWLSRGRVVTWSRGRMDIILLSARRVLCRDGRERRQRWRSVHIHQDISESGLPARQLASNPGTFVRVNLGAGPRGAGIAAPIAVFRTWRHLASVVVVVACRPLDLWGSVIRRAVGKHRPRSPEARLVVRESKSRT